MICELEGLLHVLMCTELMSSSSNKKCWSVSMKDSFPDPSLFCLGNVAAALKMHTSPASGTVPLAVQWVRLDPGCEALAATKVLQPEAAWALQLERSQDVAAQSAAVQGLAALQPTTYGVVNALRACLDNPNVYCRCVATC